MTRLASRLTGRLLLAAALLAGVAPQAHADMDYYTSMTGHERGTDVLRADMQACAQKVGPTRNGQPTSRAYKACMRRYGWRFDHTEVEHTWIDPETGLTCRDILDGLGSSCSNF